LANFVWFAAKDRVEIYCRRTPAVTVMGYTKSYYNA